MNLVAKLWPKKAPTAATITDKIAGIRADRAAAASRQAAAEATLQGLATLTDAEHAAAEADRDASRRAVQRADAQLVELQAAQKAAAAREAHEALTTRRDQVDRRVQAEAPRLLAEYDRIAAQMATVLGALSGLDRDVSAINSSLKAVGRLEERIATVHARFRYAPGVQEPDRVEVVEEWIEREPGGGWRRAIQITRQSDGGMAPPDGGQVVTREIVRPGRKHPDTSLPSLDEISLPAGRIGGEHHWPTEG